MVKVAQKLEITVLPVVGLLFHPSAMEDVVRVMLWPALLNEVRQSGAHAPICVAIEQRTARLQLGGKVDGLSRRR